MSNERVFLALGSNVGDRLQNLVKALQYLKKKVAITQCSSVYTSQPMYILKQPEFYNMAIEVVTELSPEELLHFCKEIEQTVGRVQRQRNGPREIDVDILFYGNREVSQPNLQIPHPRIAERPFVVVPLVEIAPEYQHLVEDLGEFEPLIKSVSAGKLQTLL
ncbi:MAG: 2-amino-4-hydroxy-6-hydroxymethyldihydropteridine diphosphokinase [Candidatus Pacebacteria bacterium]|nr:2-amino-4-hydroxy-6-hydroxymethyldihydropteridine diphosphokinase [Candidatus Paceibacterota bacterium]